MGHKLVGYLLCECRIEAAINIDRRQFLMLAYVICFKFRALTFEFRLFSVGLRVDRYVLTGSHRHCPGDQTGYSSDQNVTASPMRSRNAKYEARCRYYAIVRAQYRSTQPADAFGPISFLVRSGHFKAFDRQPFPILSLIGPNVSSWPILL